MPEEFEQSIVKCVTENSRPVEPHLRAVSTLIGWRELCKLAFEEEPGSPPVVVTPTPAMMSTKLSEMAQVFPGSTNVPLQSSSSATAASSSRTLAPMLPLPNGPRLRVEAEPCQEVPPMKKPTLWKFNRRNVAMQCTVDKDVGHDRRQSDERRWSASTASMSTMSNDKSVEENGVHKVSG